MSDGTKIEWTDATWNPITGCSVVSPGCTNCYAMKLSGTRLKHHQTRAGLTTDSKAGPVWNGQVRFNEAALPQPLRWKRPRRIFVCAHGDLFHESVPDEWTDRVFAVMALSPQHTFQVLTKRAGRMREYLTSEWTGFRIRNAMQELFKQPIIEMTWPLPNAWLGVSVEDQARADERIPDLLAAPAAVRFLSMEPLLGPVDIQRWIERCHAASDGDCIAPSCPQARNWKSHCPLDSWGDWRSGDEPDFPLLDWVIVGGESGPGARPMHPGWVRSIRDQCATAGVPFFFKQWGEWGDYFGSIAGDPGQYAAHWAGTGRWSFFNQAPRQFFIFSADAVRKRVGKKAAGRLLDGVEHSATPEGRS